MQRQNDIATGSASRIGGLSGNGRRDAGDDVSGEGLARLFKYRRILKDSSLSSYGVSLGRVSAKSFYEKHKKAFDDTSSFFLSHGLDARPYIRFFVDDLCKNAYDIDGSLYSRQCIRQYADKLQAAEKRRKVYSWIMKSVSNLADMCVNEGHVSGKDCVLSLIRRKRVAAEFVGGRVSKYFFAAMPGFRDVIPTLDHFSKAEFAELYDKFDIYNTEANEAFLAVRNRTVNPLRLVDEELARRKAGAGKA